MEKMISSRMERIRIRLSGVPKVVKLMMTFFSTSPYTPVWFCKSGSSCPN